jgi:hypothetical protein
MLTVNTGLTRACSQKILYSRMHAHRKYWTYACTLTENNRLRMHTHRKYWTHACMPTENPGLMHARSQKITAYVCILTENTGMTAHLVCMHFLFWKFPCTLIEMGEHRLTPPSIYRSKVSSTACSHVATQQEINYSEETT